MIGVEGDKRDSESKKQSEDLRYVVHDQLGQLSRLYAKIRRMNYLSLKVDQHY